VSQTLILLIEPDSQLRDFLQSALGLPESDFRFIHASNGAEGLENALKHRPNLILLEAQLPDTAGLELLRALKSYPRTAHIPVLFLAGGLETFLEKNALEGGAHDFIKKPLDIAEVRARLRNTLRRTTQEFDLHPQTRLITGRRLQTALAQARQSRQQHAELELSLEGLALFEDIHGFMATHEVLLFTAYVLNEALSTYGQPDDLLGQLDQNQFIIITGTEGAAALQKALLDRLTAQLPQFHSYEERDRGYMESVGEGGKRQSPLLRAKVNLSHFA